MQVQQAEISVRVSFSKNNAALLRSLADTIDAHSDLSDGGNQAVSETTEVQTSDESTDKPKRVRRTKAQIEADEAAAKGEDSNSGEESTDDDADADLGLDEEVTLSLQDDIIPACQAFVKKHDKVKLAKILTSFKVKSVRDLKEEQYADVIKKLKA